jgi:hypothetical protein
VVAEGGIDAGMAGQSQDGDGETDLEPFDFAVPAFPFGFGDAGAIRLSWILAMPGRWAGERPVHAAAQAA